LLNWQYQYPQAFWLLLLLPFFGILYLLYAAWKRRIARRIGDERLVRALYKNFSGHKALLKFFLLLAAFALGCLTLANPRVQDESSPESRKGIDIVVALDVSNSMLAEDMPPSRMARARQFISRMMEGVKDDRIGLIVFAGNAYMQMPLTFDYAAARLYVSAAHPSMISTQGTSVADALEKSGLVFGEENDRFKTVILITDGESHDENAVEAAKKLARQGVMINTIGIGSPEGTTIMDTATKEARRDESGQVVISKLNEPLLRDIAAATNGVYVHLQTAEEAVKAVMAQYVNIEKKALGDASLYNYETYYMWVALPLLLLLLLEFFIPYRKKETK